jgi:hypothetical protein
MSPIFFNWFLNSNYQQHVVLQVVVNLVVARQVRRRSSGLRWASDDPVGTYRAAPWKSDCRPHTMKERTSSRITLFGHRIQNTRPYCLQWQVFVTLPRTRQTRCTINNFLCITNSESRLVIPAETLVVCLGSPDICRDNTSYRPQRFFLGWSLILEFLPFDNLQSKQLRRSNTRLDRPRINMNTI